MTGDAFLPQMTGYLGSFTRLPRSIAYLNDADHRRNSMLFDSPISDGRNSRTVQKMDTPALPRVTGTNHPDEWQSALVAGYQDT